MKPKAGFDTHPENINRSGRPKKGKTLTDILEKHGGKKDVKVIGPDGEEILLSRREALAKELWELALTGDVAAIKYIYDRIDGKPIDTVKVHQSGDMVYRIIPAQIPKEEGDEDDNDN